MANSYVRFTGNGSTDTYTLGFPYRSKSDITVTINGSATTAFTWNGAGVAGNYIYGDADRGGPTYPNSPFRFSDTTEITDSSTNPSGAGVSCGLTNCPALSISSRPCRAAFLIFSY